MIVRSLLWQRVRTNGLLRHMRDNTALVAAALLLCGCAGQPQQSRSETRSEKGSEDKCPAFTRPDSVHRDGLTVRACSDRHGNIVCVEFGGRLHCRDDDGASLINPGG